MHMSLAQQKAAVLSKPGNGAKTQFVAFKAVRVPQRKLMTVRAATAAAAPPASGEIKNKAAELAINGAML